MFDDPKEKTSKKESDLESEFAGLPLADLLALRAKIDAALPMSQLSEMNMEHEVVIQFMTVKALQEQVLADENEEVSRKSQV